MTTARQPAKTNRLLALLPEPDFSRIAADLALVVLPRGTVLAEPGQPVDFIYFLTGGVGSVVVHTPDGNRAEAGLFGREGYIPTAAVAGLRESPHEVIVQIDAEALRMGFDAFQSLMEEDPPFRRLSLRAIEVFAIQLAYTAASNAIHDVNVRLARWLLMYHDRIGDDEIRLTHDVMAIMLAVRRSSVTIALHILEGHRLVRAGRGIVTIRNRKGLELFAHDAYGQPETAFHRLMHFSPERAPRAD